MEKNYIDITKRISGDLRKLRQDIPDTMKAFSALAQAAGRDGAPGQEDQRTNRACDRDCGALRRLYRLSHGSAGQARRHPPGGGGNPRHDHLYGRRAVADVRGRAISAFEEFQVQLGVAA